MKPKNNKSLALVLQIIFSKCWSQINIFVCIQHFCLWRVHFLIFHLAKTKTFLLGNKMSRLGLLTTMQDANFSAMQLPEGAGRLVGGIDQGSAEAGRLRGCSPGGPWSLASKFIWGHRRPGPVPGQLYQLSCSRVSSFLKTLDTQPHH